MRKSVKPFFVAVAAAVLCGCATSEDRPVVDPVKADKSIVILYENDVHCGIDGYTRLAGLRDAIQRSDTAYTAAVCCGDFIQGGTPGAISRGQYIIDIMRHVGYQAVTIGNHEFDYGVPRMKELLAKVNAPVVCANFYDAGASEPYFPSYVIHQFGDKRIAFVGAVTPETMILENYAFYDDHDQQICTLKPGEFYGLVQQAVDEARSEGANYVVLVSHVGEETQSMGFDSHRLIAATRGIDVVLDGHSHNVIPHDEVANLDGRSIGITQTGTLFANVGKLLIKDGHFSTSLIPCNEIPYENAKVTAATDSVKAVMATTMDRVVCTSKYLLEALDQTGYAVARLRETNAGDLVADAYRTMMGADLSLENAGALRASIAAGNVTYGHVTALSPYDQHVCMIEATGAEIVEALRQSTASLPAPSGNFPQCSGLKYTIHTVSHSVSDVLVLEGDSYVPVDPDKTYTVALTAFYKGGGFNNVFKKCRLLKTSTGLTREVITKFLEENLGGVIPPVYAKPQGRITILAD